MKFTHRKEEDFSLQLTPLIDVVFLLLIFFMVSTAFVDFTKKLDIELPEAKAALPTAKAEVVTIEIDRQGRILMDGKEMAQEALASALATANPRSVIVRADKTVQYGTAVEVMGLCRQAGIQDIGLAVR